MTGRHAAVLAVALYLFLRWMLRPLAARLPAGITVAVDLTGALLLVPEYLCTAVFRKLIDRSAPLAFAYGEAVSGLAVLAHSLGLIVADAVHQAAAQVNHLNAVVGCLIGTACVALLL